MANYFVLLEKELSAADKNWRDRMVLVLDNCSSHKTALARLVLARLGFPVLFSAPASYRVLPVELLFGAVK